MIRSKRELNFTRKRLADFAKVIAEFDLNHPPARVQPEAHRAAYDALVGLHAGLRAEIEQYERLFTEGMAAVRVEKLADVPAALIQARIAQGLTQARLADRLGVRPQQVQRWESQDYENAEFATILDVANALGLEECFQRTSVEKVQDVFSASSLHLAQLAVLPTHGIALEQSMWAAFSKMGVGLVSLPVSTAKAFDLCPARSAQTTSDQWKTFFGARLRERTSSVAAASVPAQRQGAFFPGSGQVHDVLDVQNDLQAEIVRLKVELARANAELDRRRGSLTSPIVPQQQSGQRAPEQPIAGEQFLDRQLGFAELIQ